MVLLQNLQFLGGPAEKKNALAGGLADATHRAGSHDYYIKKSSL